MSRLAITLGKTHGGKWELLAGPDVPIMEQLAQRKEFLIKTSDEDYSTVLFQESDGMAQMIRLRSPDEQKAFEEKRAKDKAAADEAGKKYQQSLVDSVKKAEDDRIKGHQTEIAARDKVAMEVRQRSKTVKK